MPEDRVTYEATQLIGGASLKAEEFKQIVDAAAEVGKKRK